MKRTVYRTTAGITIADEYEPGQPGQSWHYPADAIDGKRRELAAFGVDPDALPIENEPGLPVVPVPARVKPASKAKAKK